MAAPTISTVGYNPTDPNGSKTYMQQMLAAQLQAQMAEQQMADGGQPDPNGFIPGNSLAPGRAVPVSSVANLAKALEKVTGAYGQKAAMQKQIDLQTAMMQRQYGMMSNILGGGGGTSDPGQAALQKAYMAKMMGAPDEVVKGIVEYGQPAANAAYKPSQVTLPDGSTRMMTDLQQSQMANGGGQSAVPPALPQGIQSLGGAAQQSAPLPPDVDAQYQAAENAGFSDARKVVIPGFKTDTSQIYPSAAAAQNAQGDPVQEFKQAQAQQQALPLGAVNSAMGAMGNPDAMTGGAPSSTPPAMAPIPGFKDAPSAAPSQSPPALQQPTAPQSPGFAVQNPSEKEGLTKDYQNFSDYKQKLNDTVNEGAGQLRIINAQEDFAKNFKPGAGEATLAHLATVAKSLGAGDGLVNMISRGDPGSVEAFDSLASQHAARQAEMLLSGGGNGTPRISQAVFESFKNDLSDPNKQANATAAINALTRQQYQDSFNEQQALSNYKGDPLKFRSQYAQGMNKTLMDGRSADPTQAINQGVQKTAPMTTPPPVSQRQPGMIVNSPQGPVKWTGTGWMKVQNAQ